MTQPPDPGPIDKSVLVEQEHHKSEAIFTGRIWAWEHIRIGRPDRLEVKALLHDRPLGCRWNVPFKSRENVRSIDTEFYRHGLDTILDSQVDLVMTVQRQIRRLLSGEVERKRLKENLAEIDAYISTELEKAKPSTSEVGHSHSRQKQKIRASSPRYLTPPTAIPLAIEAGIATRFIESVQHSPVMQALPIKADPDSEDNNHEEGNTIMELDQTRSIEPVGIQLQEEAIDSSSKEANEENGKVKENVNEPMEKINVRETANETIENDEQMETIVQRSRVIKCKTILI
uniref:Uncharacterized protein n=1 Tax=Ananas comosus var. bracteatus TaxID=296719 RepID=A0A6V7NLX2_ANACO|nr:unnamed protein product [Ananas comosus var. bracteatus]